jgi:hypothetical protein
MRSIQRAAQRGNTPTDAQNAVQQAARALLQADRKQIDKSDREFLKVASRHGNVNGEGVERIARLAGILNGGRHD